MIDAVLNRQKVSLDVERGGNLHRLADVLGVASRYGARRLGRVEMVGYPDGRVERLQVGVRWTATLTVSCWSSGGSPPLTFVLTTWPSRRDRPRRRAHTEHAGPQHVTVRVSVFLGWRITLVLPGKPQSTFGSRALFPIPVAIWRRRSEHGHRVVDAGPAGGSRRASAKAATNAGWR